MEQQKADDILAELQRLVGLTAALVLRPIRDAEGSQQEMIEALGTAGLEPVRIAELLGTSPPTVRSALNRARKRSK